jgi:uncharacterized protein DUF3175
MEQDGRCCARYDESTRSRIMAKAKAKAKAKTKAKSKAKAKAKTGSTAHRWSHQVMEHSDALDLEQGVFTKPSARQVALSLKRSADRSQRRKSDPFRSALSMLTFHMNRAGKNLPAARKRVLMQAKDELRRLYDK